MRFAFEDVADHPATGIARSHLEENAYAVSVGLLDDLGVVNRLQRLAENHIGSTVSGDLIALTQIAAVKSNVLGCGHREKMQIPVRLRHRLGNLAMHCGYTTQGEEVTIDFARQGFDLVTITTNHALLMGIDNQQVGPVFADKSLFHLFCRSINKT